jgi:hypothetical protein
MRHPPVEDLYSFTSNFQGAPAETEGARSGPRHFSRPGRTEVTEKNNTRFGACALHQSRWGSARARPRQKEDPKTT